MNIMRMRIWIRQQKEKQEKKEWVEDNEDDHEKHRRGYNGRQTKWTNSDKRGVQARRDKGKESHKYEEEFGCSKAKEGQS